MSLVSGETYCKRIGRSSQQMTEAFDVTLLLASWGKERQIGDAYHLDYPHVSPYASEMRQSDRWSARMPSLPEDRHSQVDKVVSRLKSLGGHRHDAIVLCYIEGMNDRQIGKKLRMSKSSARTVRQAGENWIEGALLSVDI